MGGEGDTRYALVDPGHNKDTFGNSWLRAELSKRQLWIHCLVTSMAANSTEQICEKFVECGNFLMHYPGYCHKRHWASLGECTILESYLRAVIPPPYQQWAKVELS